jgi:hypothetical protein
MVSVQGKSTAVFGAKPSLAKIALVFLLTLPASLPLPAAKPVYAKKAVGFPTRCWSDAVRECRALRIPSPDGRTSVAVTYHKMPLQRGDYILRASLLVIQKDGTRVELEPRGMVEAELLWSPDSTSFLVNSSDGGEGPQFVEIYRLHDLKGDPGYAEGPSSLVAAAQHDMVKSFPPCRAKDADAKECAGLAEHPESINVAGVDWTRGSSAIVVMAEIPCSSRFGGVMCQVLGYELDASTGRILRRMQPREFAKEWQPSMAWKFHDPGPPEYQDK